MRPLTTDDILSIEAFTAARQAHMREVLAVKRPRRVSLGTNLTVLFENRTTMRWQVHEMCRVEGIRKPEGVAHEVKTYNALVPGANELKATLLVEYPDADERRRMSHALVGLHEAVSLRVDGQPPALLNFDHAQYEDGRISMVQYVTVTLTDDQVRAFCDLTRAAKLVVEHPAYSVEVPLSPTTRGALIEDLQAD